MVLSWPHAWRSWYMKWCWRLVFVCRLDTQLYKHCRLDAKKICQAPDHWYLPASGNDAYRPPMKQLVFACLYRHLVQISSNPSYKVRSEYLQSVLFIIMLWYVAKVIGFKFLKIFFIPSATLRLMVYVGLWNMCMMTNKRMNAVIESFVVIYLIVCMLFYFSQFPDLVVLRWSEWWRSVRWVLILIHRLQKLAWLISERNVQIKL